MSKELDDLRDENARLKVDVEKMSSGLALYVKENEALKAQVLQLIEALEIASSSFVALLNIYEFTTEKIMNETVEANIQMIENALSSPSLYRYNKMVEVVRCAKIVSESDCGFGQLSDALSKLDEVSE